MRKIKTNFRAEYANLKQIYLGQVVQNLRMASVAYDPDIYIEQAIQNVLDLKTATATLTEFQQYIKGKTFLNPKTKNEVVFDSLPPESQKKIRQHFKSQFEDKKSNKSVGENIVEYLGGIKGNRKKIAESILKVPSAIKDFFTNPKKRKEIITESLTAIKDLSNDIKDKAVSYLKREFAVEEWKSVGKLFKKDPTDGETFIDDDGNETTFDKLSKKEKYRWREKKLRKAIPKLAKSLVKISTMISFGYIGYKASGLVGLAGAGITHAKEVGTYMIKGVIKETAKKTAQNVLGINDEEYLKLEAVSLKGIGIDPDVEKKHKHDDKDDKDKKNQSNPDDEKNQSNPDDEIPQKNYSSIWDVSSEDLKELKEQAENHSNKMLGLEEGKDEEEEEEDKDESEKQQMSVGRKVKKTKSKLASSKKKDTNNKETKPKDDDDKMYHEIIDEVRRQMMNTLVDKKWYSKEFFQEAVNSIPNRK